MSCTFLQYGDNPLGRNTSVG